MSNDIRQGQFAFRDDVNFPRGISRCGVFSISQSELLKNYGETLKQLDLGTLSPENEAEQDFVAFCRGARQAQTTIEKLWEKYQQEIRRKKSFHTVLSSRHNASNSPSYHQSDDMDYAV